MAAWTVWIPLMCAALTGQGSNAQDCGMSSLNTRIVGGEDAAPGAWPWMVSVHINRGGVNQHICGGTLINNEWVLTAAHCIVTSILSEWLLFLGRDTQSGPNNNEVSRTVSTVIIHPRYTSARYNNDIALMKLSGPVTFTDHIKPICLASSTSDFHSTTSCWATGWGKHGRDVPINPDDSLHEVQIPVVGTRECRCNYRPLRSVRITGEMICAGEEDKGACQGDSGGPLQCKQGSRWIQAGITSFGVPCALGTFPEVYTRVSQFESWITSQASVNFVTFTSSGTDSDESFRCRRSSFRNVTTAAPNPTTTKASKASTIATELTLVVSLVTVFLQFIVAP